MSQFTSLVIPIANHNNKVLLPICKYNNNSTSVTYFDRHLPSRSVSSYDENIHLPLPIVEEEEHKKSQIPNRLRYRSLNKKEIKHASDSSTIFNQLWDHNMYLSNYEKYLKANLKSYLPILLLDVPCMKDDYYTSIFDFSCENVLVIVIANNVYLWEETTSDDHQITILCNYPLLDQITYIKWSPSGTHVVIGTQHGNLDIWNVLNQQIVHALQGHYSSITALSWHKTKGLASGDKEGYIIIHEKDLAFRISKKYKAHLDKVCGLEWNVSGDILASGGNDNVASIWQIGPHLTDAFYDMKIQPLSNTKASCRTNTGSCSLSIIYPSFQSELLWCTNKPQHLDFLKHTACVKAIVWCSSHILATGSGIADRHIYIWDTLTGHLLNSTYVGSQISSLQFNAITQTLISTQGYSSNDIMMWSYPAMKQISQIQAHEKRILNSVLSKDGTTLITLGADEKIAFWKVFSSSSSNKTKTIKKHHKRELFHVIR